jgi:biotin carboxyl carrier protein
MKLRAQLGAREHELYLERRGNRVVARVDDRSYELEVREPAPGEYVLIHEGSIHDCLVDHRNEQRGVFEVHLRGASYELTLTDPKRLRSAQASGAQNSGAARIVAPMPGKVVRVLVEIGAEVEAGAGIVVVEAMKMQNEMKAPKAGTVVSLTAVAGDTVNAGDALATIE